MNDLIKENIIKKKDKIFLNKKKIIIHDTNIKKIKVKDGSITFTVDEKQDKVVINFRGDEITLTKQEKKKGYRGTKDLTFSLQEIFEAWKFQTETSVHVGIEKPQKSCWKIKHNDDGKIYAKFINNGCTINGGGKIKSRRKRIMSKKNLRKKKSKRNLRKNKKKSKKINAIKF